MCRSFLYYDKTKTCVLYPDDPVGDSSEEQQQQRALKPSSGDLYRLFCGTSDRGKLTLPCIQVLAVSFFFFLYMSLWNFRCALVTWSTVAIASVYNSEAEVISFGITFRNFPLGFFFGTLVRLRCSYWVLLLFVGHSLNFTMAYDDRHTFNLFAFSSKSFRDLV